MMISKIEFVTIVNHLKEINDFSQEINDKAKKLNDSIMRDFFNITYLGVFEDDVVKLLENMFNTETISWWFWEKDYGRKFKIGDLIKADKTKPDLSTAEKLYDYLISKEG